MFGFSPQIIIATALMALSAIGGWKVSALIYEAEISDMRKDKAQAVAMAESANRQAELLQLEKDGLVSLADALEHRRKDTQFRTVTRELVKYVKSDSPKPYLPADWVHIYNASAPGGAVSSSSEAPGAANGSPGTVRADTALEYIAANNDRCADYRRIAQGLQSWAAGLE